MFQVNKIGIILPALIVLGQDSWKQTEKAGSNEKKDYENGGIKNG